MKTNMEDLTYESQVIQLGVVTHAVRTVLEDEGFPTENYELTMTRGFMLDQLGKDMVFQLTRRIPKEELGEVSISYPADWWQAFKDRWYPAWLKKMFPVKFTYEVLKATAFYDKVSLPEENPYITFHKLNHKGAK